MSADQLFSILWRRKLIVLATVVIATATTYLISQSLQPVYSASSTLFVGDRNQAGNDFEAIQSGQVIARTYAELIQSRTVAERVADALPGAADADQILGRTEFEPVSDTQLVVITAEGNTPEDAALLANIYANVFSRYAADTLATRTKSDVTVADRAQPPSAPVRPRPALYAGVVFVLSIFLGAGLALLRDRLDTRLGSEEEISEALALPVLGRIPRVKSSRRDEQRFLEHSRVLNTNLRFLHPTSAISTVLITSASPAEGKSTVAMGLARAAAEQGKRIVLVEGDLRRPHLSEAMGLEPSAPGLVHYLALGWNFEDVVHETATPELHVVPAGAIPPNPSSLLQPTATERMLTDARQWADFVVVDSPPLSAGADVSILAHAVDTVLFVVNYRRSRRHRALAAVGQLRQARARVDGLVLNEVGDEAGYYYSYGRPTGEEAPPALAEPPRSRQAS
jgi:capsular exopolysaccharide synthesis family protein